MIYTKHAKQYRRLAIIGVVYMLLDAIGDNDGSVWNWAVVVMLAFFLAFVLMDAYRYRQDRIRFEQKFAEAMKNPGPLMVWQPPEEGR